MTILTRLSTVLGGVLILACMLACGAFGKVQQAADRAKRMNDLRQIGLAWQSYNDTFRKAPSGPDDLAKFLDGPSSEPLQGLKSGKYVLIYNVSLSDIIRAPDSPGTSNLVLGYEATTAQNGGLVLMANGFVEQKTAAEFGRLKKVSDYAPPIKKE